ncbi:MAG: hypothetical protein K2H18_08295 [Muribaculaceae bacterium]|nr:hypothetical protein [Muribaculaceae bacterium]MDE6296854.1 hypothetical protein [Muribaculaceae bacterium]
MKKYLLLFIFSIFSLTAPARSISDVQKDGTWYRIFDENGKLYKTVSEVTTGELKGFSSTIIIFQNGAFFYVYDTDFKKLFTGAVATCGEINSVAGNTFTTKYGNWIYTYDKNGKKINTRAF